MNQPEQETKADRLYDCPRTGRQETVTITTTLTTVTQHRGRSQTLRTTSFTRDNITKCTGWDDCGVRKAHASGTSAFENFTWALCPLMTTLSTR